VNSTSWIQFVLAAVACGVLLLASLAIVRFSKQLKDQVSPSGGSGGGRSGGSLQSTAMSRDTYNMARKLKEQGVSTAALAGMSAAEQQFFLETMSARLGDGTGPRLVRPPAGAGGTATAAAPAEAAPIPAAALVTGPIHCPVCRTVIGQRSEPGPTMQKCPGCSRRVTTKVEGDRLHVTVSYGMGTPARGSSAIRPR
jgi:CO/xanthine dehydrogenase Mo-binding subunit